MLTPPGKVCSPPSLHHQYLSITGSHNLLTPTGETRCASRNSLVCCSRQCLIRLVGAAKSMSKNRSTFSRGRQAVHSVRLSVCCFRDQSICWTFGYFCDFVGRIVVVVAVVPVLDGDPPLPPQWSLPRRWHATFFPDFCVSVGASFPDVGIGLVFANNVVSCLNHYPYLLLKEMLVSNVLGVNEAV